MSYVAPSGNDVRFVFNPGMYTPPDGDALGFVFNDIVGVAGVGTGSIPLSGSGYGTHREPVIGVVSEGIGLTADGTGLSIMLLGSAAAVIGLTGSGQGTAEAPTLISGMGRASILSAFGDGSVGVAGVASSTIQLKASGVGARGSVLSGRGSVSLSAYGVGQVGRNGDAEARIEIAGSGHGKHITAVYGIGSVTLQIGSNSFGVVMQIGKDEDYIYISHKQNRIEVRV